jgi:hypothetical protein
MMQGHSLVRPSEDHSNFCSRRSSRSTANAPFKTFEKMTERGLPRLSECAIGAVICTGFSRPRKGHERRVKFHRVGIKDAALSEFDNIAAAIPVFRVLSAAERDRPA